MSQNENKPNISIFIAVVTLILAIVAFIFGDNLYQQITGHSFFAPDKSGIAQPGINSQGTPVVTNCPSPSSYAIEAQSLKPGMSISGPATIHPYDGGAELAQALGLTWVSRWGINVRLGITVQIPQTITLLSGNQYTPDGYVDIYLDDARMDAAQQCWLLNNP